MWTNLIQNTDRLATHFNKLVDAQRELEDRTSRIYMSVSDMHEKLEQLIATYNCDKAYALGPERLITDRKYSSTNSFMRGLNTYIDDKVLEGFAKLAYTDYTEKLDRLEVESH